MESGRDRLLEMSDLIHNDRPILRSHVIHFDYVSHIHGKDPVESLNSPLQPPHCNFMAWNRVLLLIERFHSLTDAIINNEGQDINQPSSI